MKATIFFHSFSNLVERTSSWSRGSAKSCNMSQSLSFLTRIGDNNDPYFIDLRVLLGEASGNCEGRHLRNAAMIFTFSFTLPLLIMK
jgi:hypothetical protein